MTYTRRSYRELLWPLLACAVVLGIEVPGCKYWAGPLPLGVDNEVRATNSPASSGWAQPMELPGLSNLHKVSSNIYRGAAPTAEGIQQLKKLGIETIVDLRDVGSPDDLRGTGMTYVRIPATAWQPEEKDVVQFLQTVTDAGRLPVFVHCQRGADRTGMMCAIYRVAVQGWSKDEAIEEMTKGGFGHHAIWKNLAQFIRDLDIDQVKHAAGLTPKSSSL